jgi:hypothetical protein
MEIIATAGASLMSVFTGGAATAATAGGAATAASAGGLSALSGGLSIFSSLASAGSGIMGLITGLGNAQGHRNQGRSDIIAGEEKAADIMEARNRNIANNMVAAAAMGLDVTGGEPVDAAVAAEADAARQIEIERTNAALRRRIRSGMARQAEIGGVSQLISGLGGAAKELASSQLRTARRGGPAAEAA